jgi:hypothetical protein
VILVGFGFRAIHLGAEGLSEDELNKLQAVEDYRAHGLTSANGEHPMLMKALLTVSIVASEQWNQLQFVASRPALTVSKETALRFPATIVGALTSLLIFLVVSELFGSEIGLIAAVLWAIDPTGISFNRIAKEDTFLLFFFLLANVFWVRGQRVAESGEGKPEPYYWATAVSFGAMMASKYMTHYLAISVSYYYIYQGIPATRWRLGKRKWLIFFAIMGATFLVLNPTILLPGTWRAIGLFAGEKRIGHDSYEFMGTLYRNQVTLWLQGVPWYFYYVFLGLKLALPVVAAFLIGLSLLFRKRLGDGRFLILFWLFYWFMPFSVMGGKFTRYFTMVLPVVLITAAIGLHYVAETASRLVSRVFENRTLGSYVRAAIIGVALTFSAVASADSMPHYRLYTNALGGGWSHAGNYFPHDEFYDASTRQAAIEVAARARPGARVASETPSLVEFYAKQAGRNDLVSVSLSDHAAVQQFQPGDIVIDARGRRYFSNEALMAALRKAKAPDVKLLLGQVPSLEIYTLDQPAAQALIDAAR